MDALPGRSGWDERCDRFALRLSPRLERLHRTCQACLNPFWADASRRAAFRQAQALSRLCRAYGFDDVARLTRALASLLRLPPEEVAALEKDVKERVEELLEMIAESSPAGRRIA